MGWGDSIRAVADQVTSNASQKLQAKLPISLKTKSLAANSVRKIMSARVKEVDLLAQPRTTKVEMSKTTAKPSKGRRRFWQPTKTSQRIDCSSSKSHLRASRLKNSWIEKLASQVATKKISSLAQKQAAGMSRRSPKRRIQRTRFWESGRKTHETWSTQANCLLESLKSQMQMKKEEPLKRLTMKISSNSITIQLTLKV